MRRMEGRVLLTGATGYVGGRLLPALEARRLSVRCLARDPAALAGRVRPSTQVVRGDCLDPVSLKTALEDVETAVYLVHSLGSDGDFEATDREAARNFGRAAAAAGVRRIVYLGGLGDARDGLSAHLRSRQETGAALGEAGVSVVELRASVVIGSGSLSYEMIRALVEHLPVMLCPRWVRTPTQPIGVEDVVAYLEAAVDLPDGVHGVFEIGGPDVVSYGELMLEYARQRGLRRWLIPVPVLTPNLSSLWLRLVTPLQARVGRKLVGSLRNPTTVRSDRALRTFDVRPRPLREAIARALKSEDAEVAATRWSDALSSSSRSSRRPRGERAAARLIDSRSALVDVPPLRAFAPIRRIGGARGWYYGAVLWRVRGLLDEMVGGVGLRRGRRDPESLRVGEALDWWRVEAFEPGRLLRLSSELRLPGRAWLQFEVTPRGAGSEIRQTALFDPVGLGGRLYWYALLPVHEWMFAGMLRRICALALRAPEGPDAPAAAA